MMKEIFPLIFVSMIFVFSKSSIAQNADVAKSSSQPVFSYVEQMPQFKGGQEAMATFISTHLKYPKKAKKKHTEGKVIVKFIVAETGKVEHVEVIRGIGNGCDEAAKKVVEQMPDWIPGKQNGKPVAVYFTLPIAFKLN
jgi:periplasmic protein TonB